MNPQHEPLIRKRPWFPPLIIPTPCQDAQTGVIALPDFARELDLAEFITVVTTTNPIPSIPSTKIIYATQKSLFRIAAFKHCKKLIVFDGVQPQFSSRASDYEQYKRNIAHHARTDSYFANTDLVFCSDWVGLAGAIRTAFEHVTTPFIFIHQHDFFLVKNFDLRGVIATMLVNENVKHVRLGAGPTNTYFRMHDWHIDEVIEGPYYVPLSRTFGWSDNDHVTTLDYYLNFVLPRCHRPRVFIEHVLNPALRQSIRQYGPDGHKPFGTYFYGAPTDGDYIHHIDGRERVTSRSSLERIRRNLDAVGEGEKP